MTFTTRRTFLGGLAVAAGGASARGQGAGPPEPNPFRYEDVVRRARDLAARPFDPANPPLPEAIARLDFDAYRDIRFRPDRALLGSAGGPFRMQLFHLGFLYSRPVTINIVREGVPTPVPYHPDLFDFGRTKIEGPLPVNLGFAGFRLHYPLNSPRILDEVIAFLGASYFRFLGREQRYGLSARGLAVNVDGREPEEFPFFREFWIELPPSEADRAVIYGLLDGMSVTGAYRFVLYPGAESPLDVTATLFARRSLEGVGIAPLTSMFFVGENERRFADDFRPEIHDSDGLQIHSSTGEWIWRPLRNPVRLGSSAFVDANPRGFGLMQRDRVFEDYQDLEAFYHRRPGYWVEPQGSWGEGRVDLVEIPTADETHDNIVAFWRPRQPLEAGQEAQFSYRLRSIGSTDDMHNGGKVVNTFQTRTQASGGRQSPADLSTRRFIVDFGGGDLSFYLNDPAQVQIVPTTSAGRITHSSLVPNDHIQGFRAAIDLRLEPGQSADLRAFLRAGSRTLTETWIYAWAAE
jgi:glucans biosynthesis protein